MKKFAFALLVVSLSFPSYTFAQKPVSAPVPQNPQTIAVSQIHPGMRGVAYTVFQGVKPEAMDVEVLGVLHNTNGPKGNVILVRLHGQKVEYTGVVAGMSGSPVYIEGKLAGALAFRIGEFSKEPIAGVTPIADMLEISALDRSPAEETAASKPSINVIAGKSASPGEISALPGSTEDTGKDFSNYLRPIETPLVFNGFSEQAIHLFAGQFASAGIVPVMGAGSISDEKQPEPVEAGSAISAILVRGDMNIEATCTVTYVDPQRLLACGHPLLQFGSVDLPMNKAEVLATLPSPMNAFKIVNTTEPVGTFVQDRHTGILGVFDRQPEMIPVTLSIHSGAGVKQFHYEVLNNPKLTPVALMVTVFNALHGVNEFGEEITYRLAGSIGVKGFPEVTMRNMFAPSENAQPAAMQAAISLGERFGRIYDNPFNAPAIAGVKLDFDLVRERRWARLESARTDVTEARPGDEIMLETVLAPYRGERIVQQIPVKIPTSASKGTLRILVSDGETLDHIGHANAAFGRTLDLASTIALLNKEHSNNRVYVSLLEADPEARVADKVMPTLPISIMNVMDGMRGNQEMVVSGESNVDETATAPLDYVVSGAHLLTVTVK
ncbi:MAG TPA: SpoIVB peptidase S55 domain-containing protein [Candidatus Eremiobacteraceae bacterium]|nr:SpoIVB peptidase S55 domain-containing protein [Candidatus Eremiobacteraceae bacterium]